MSCINNLMQDQTMHASLLCRIELCSISCKKLVHKKNLHKEAQQTLKKRNLHQFLVQYS